ncbi:MAG: branched-chain amino acid--2-keto-4-methylthiobutyrate aminotransferase [Alphaproteobacteria bacterium]|nr:branched-chain amino acid--2-keto-4-methylthiobutyrate aminotransferase [Alphaproteobacteria bacterium]
MLATVITVGPREAAMAMPGMAYFEGRYVPIQDAKLSILEPAITKSDIVFDVVSTWDRVFFRLEDHLDRFENSYKHVKIKPPVSRDEMRTISAELVDRSGLDNSCVYMCATRGLYAGGAAFGDPRNAVNGFYAYVVPYYWVIPKEHAETGGHLWIASVRRAPSEAINQKVKNFNRMDLTAGQFEALEHGADAPILLSTTGKLTEGPGFNVWIVRGKKLLTPGKDLLEGVTRKTVFELAQESGFEPVATELTADDLLEAKEVFISSTAGGVLPITRVNDQAVGNGAPGITTGQLQKRYWEKRKRGWHGTPVDSLLVSRREKVPAE